VGVPAPPHVGVEQMSNYLTVNSVTPDDPLSLVLAGIAFLVIVAALVYTNHKLKDRF
jgi:hypothetical protein